MSRLSPEKAREIEAYVRSRVESILEWYVGCEDVHETRRNAERDLACIPSEVEERYGVRMLRVPRVRSESPGEWVVDLVDPAAS